MHNSIWLAFSIAMEITVSDWEIDALSEQQRCWTKQELHKILNCHLFDFELGAVGDNIGEFFAWTSYGGVLLQSSTKINIASIQY